MVARRPAPDPRMTPASPAWPAFLPASRPGPRRLGVPATVFLLAFAMLAAGCTSQPTPPAPSTTASTSPLPGSTSPGSTAPAPSTTPPAGTPVTLPLFEDFETGLGAWRPDSEVPPDPNRPGQAVAWNITQGDNGWEDHVHIIGHPTHGARYSLDGLQDDGTIWLERELQVQPGQAYLLNVSVRAWSATESFNTLAYLVARTATSDTEREGDFPDPGHKVESGPMGGLRETLNQQEGWLEYRYQWATPVLTDGRLHAAFGISAVWETPMTYDLDAISITATPCGNAPCKLA